MDSAWVFSRMRMPKQALSAQLAEASRQLWMRQGNAGLTVIGQDVDGQRFYLLSGSDPGAAQQ